ncbi:MAG TPA: hypothetical protein GX523_15285 [Desulfitobacterium dehalogenans]|uniref:Uncharacterized protein n=1 Tax=Desulfitobacterium dehalogenans TaxID=36854 RepID=A0A7C7DBJ4_9FIRM|nr:hypothetical protein [Desulfitobacterium dehalogenans]
MKELQLTMTASIPKEVLQTWSYEDIEQFVSYQLHQGIDNALESLAGELVKGSGETAVGISRPPSNKIAF